MEHEQALVRAFITRERRDRYLAALASPKKRSAFLNKRLPHIADLDQRYARRLDVETPLVAFDERAARHHDAIYKQLRDLGAPTRCYAVSADNAIDGQEHDLRQILDTVVGSTSGTFLSCLPGRLAYFEGEPPNQRYLLERPAGDRLKLR